MPEAFHCCSWGFVTKFSALACEWMDGFLCNQSMCVYDASHQNFSCNLVLQIRYINLFIITLSSCMKHTSGCNYPVHQLVCHECILQRNCIALHSCGGGGEGGHLNTPFRIFFFTGPDPKAADRIPCPTPQ